MKNYLVLVCTAFLLFVLAGCRLFIDTATLVVENHSTFPIDVVQMAPPEALEWDDDLLSDTIPPGDSRAFHSLTPGTYDIVVWDTDESWDFWLGEVLEPWQRHTIVYPH